MGAVLLSREETSDPRAHTEQHGSKIRNWLRQLRLQFRFLPFGRGTAWKSQTDSRKVAMYRSRKISALHAFFHLIPLGGAFTLLVLHWTQYWVGWTFDLSTALQFVAKLHEVLMQVSIVEIVLCIIRTEAVRGFVPLGALSGAVQANQISILWSLDFVSIFTSSALHGWRKVFICFAIPTLLVLTALVGPSSAILMIPRPGSQHIHETITRYAPVSFPSLYPAQFSSKNKLNLNIWDLNNTIQYASFDENFYLSRDTEKPGDSSFMHEDPMENQPRLLRFATMKGFVSSQDNNPGWASFDRTATIPTRYSADLIYKTLLDDSNAAGLDPSLYSNATRSILAAYPVVEAKCRRQHSVNGVPASIYYIQDHRSQAVLANISTLARQVNGSAEVYPIAETQVQVQFFPPVWMPSPEAGSTSLIGVFFAWSFHMNVTAAPSLDWVLTEGFTPGLEKNSMLEVTTCTISASWTTGEVQWIISESTRDRGQVQTGLLSAMERHNITPITLNPTCVDVGQGMELSRVMLHKEEAFLSGAFALAISEHYRYPYVDIHASPGRDTSNSTAFKIITKFYGYGYSTNSISITLSFVTISLYCVVTILYISYILITGSISTAWSSAIELVALALQSNKPDHLDYTSVGIDSLDTFNQGVGIRVNKDNELELVFNQDKDSRDLRKIIKNQAY